MEHALIDDRCVDAIVVVRLNMFDSLFVFGKLVQSFPEFKWLYAPSDVIGRDVLVGEYIK